MRSKFIKAARRALLYTFSIVGLGLVLQSYVISWQKPPQLPVPINREPHTTIHPLTTETTIWAAIQNDSSISTFANMLGQFDDIVQGLSVPQAKFTVYAPTNEAFENEYFPYDLPSFYWKFLVGYHMGLGAFSRDNLSTIGTVSSFVNADIFFKYKQRISSQVLSNKSISLNHKSKIMAETATVNGYLHHIDRVLMLPDSTSDVLRSTANFYLFRQGLIQTDLATTINDTSTHVGQTVFVPTETAFKKLGRKVNRFLFGPGGNEYLKALLAYHVIANQTLFSNVLYQEKGQGEIPLKDGSEITLPTLANHNLNISIDVHNSRQSIIINKDVRVVQPDVVAMDGVMHAVDAVLIPPKPESDVEDADEEVEHGSWLSFLTGKPNNQVTVEELIERLQPYMEERVE